MKRGTHMSPTMSAASKTASIVLMLRAVVLLGAETIRVRRDHGSVIGVRHRWKQQSKEGSLTSRLRDPGDPVRYFYIWGDSHGFWPLTDLTPRLACTTLLEFGGAVCQINAPALFVSIFFCALNPFPYFLCHQENPLPIVRPCNANPSQDPLFCSPFRPVTCLLLAS